MAIKVFQDFYPASSADMIVVSGFFTAVANIYEIVYAIGEDTLWGQGYGEAAIDKALRIAFSKLGTHSVIAKINPANERSRRLAAACGFRNVGTSGSPCSFTVSEAAGNSVRQDPCKSTAQLGIHQPGADSDCAVLLHIRIPSQ